MYCPILSIGKPRHVECITNTCAMWSAENNRCGIIAQQPIFNIGLAEPEFPNNATMLGVRDPGGNVDGTAAPVTEKTTTGTPNTKPPLTGMGRRR